MNNEENVLEVENLKKYFPVTDFLGHQAIVKAVDGVSFSIKKGETYGLVGESGCGKSTLGRCVLRLVEPTQGIIKFQGKDIMKEKGKDILKIRKEMQMVFQDPYMSLDPKQRVGNALMEAMKINGMGDGEERFKTAMKIMGVMGFQPQHFFRYPHEFSGGQRQRIGLARALILHPKLIVCDEPVSALDVSVQAQIINLMEDIKKDTQVSYLFISHNLSVVKHISDRIGVMYLGHMVEEADKDELFDNPLHPYTKALLSAITLPDPNVHTRRIELKGEIPSPLNAPKGCVFCTRCPWCKKICTRAVPHLMPLSNDRRHKVACFLIDSEGMDIEEDTGE